MLHSCVGGEGRAHAPADEGDGGGGEPRFGGEHQVLAPPGTQVQRGTDWEPFARWGSMDDAEASEGVKNKGPPSTETKNLLG